jgi:hypothetical protein
MNELFKHEIQLAVVTQLSDLHSHITLKTYSTDFPATPHGLAVRDGYLRACDEIRETIRELIQEWDK